MATNKNAQLRYMILDECFSNFFRRYFIDDLIEIVGEKLSEYYGEEMTISRKQIFEDIRFMKRLDSFDAPIITYRENKRGYYRYKDKNYSIRNKPITNSEKELLQEAILALSRASNISADLKLDSTLARLENEFGIKKPEKQIISFEENEFLKGLDFLNPLYTYIVDKQLLKLVYKRYGEDEEEMVFTISPYYLKQYNNRWFLYGHSHEDELLYNMPLDRIVSFEPLQGEYRENDIDFSEYFEEIVGVTNVKEAPEEKILLKFSAHRFPYVQSKPMHGSQTPAGENTIRLELKVNRELVSLLLSYGKDVTVLEPESLRDEMKGIIEEMKENYKSFDV